MAVRVWIGLAHARPTAANNDDDWAGALGGYAQTLALAEGAEEFEERVAAALEAVELELVELDDVEPITTRLASRSVDADLLELALEAAYTEKVCFDDFHVYEDEGVGEAIRSPARDVLSDAVARGHVVRLKRGPVPSQPLEGFVVGLGDG